MEKILVTNIQRFSLHDGPGIRTTVFLKGCAVHCPWCSNPENLSFQIQTYIKGGVEGEFGRYLSTEELVFECLKDKHYYDGRLDRTQWNISDAEEIRFLPGGVTFSGGECLMQMKQLVPACMALHEENVHIAVETSLFTSFENVSVAIDNIDLFYIDLKIPNAARCADILHGDICSYSENLNMVTKSGNPVVIRVPVIGGMTDDDETRSDIRIFLSQYVNSILKVELIKGHKLGESKYKSLGYEVPAYSDVPDELLLYYKDELQSIGLQVEICRM